MDEQKDEQATQDMVVGSDGSMSDGSEAQKIEVKTDAQESSSPERPAEEPVNEVAPPPAAEPTEDMKDNSDKQASDTAGSSDGMEVKQPPAEEEPISEQSTSGSSSLNELAQKEEEKYSAPSGMDSSTIAPAVAPNPTAQTPESNTAQKPQEHRNNKKLAVVMTLIIALLLAGGAVFIYMSTQSNTKESSNSSRQNDTTQEAVPVDDTPATANDVDQAAQEAEEAINALDDASDFSEESLSDQNLGIE